MTTNEERLNIIQSEIWAIQKNAIDNEQRCRKVLVRIKNLKKMLLPDERRIKALERKWKIYKKANKIPDYLIKGWAPPEGTKKIKEE